MSIKKYSIFTILIIFSILLSSCSVDDTNIQQDNQTQGPIADENRQLAKLEVKQGENENLIIKADLGNVRENNYVSPIRGIIVTPKKNKNKTPLIVINHLRAPNCSDQIFAYPCPKGKKEYRYDEGMIYLGEKLASQGYTALIPDLGPAWIGSDIETPYNQDKMWQEIIKEFIKNIKANMMGKTSDLGKNKILNVDTNNVGLVLHSRSASLVEAATKIFGENNIKSIFAYGPSYETIDEELFSPPPKDIPYFALTSVDDQDVSISANLWLSNYATNKRKTPAIVATTFGLGHNYINKTLSENNIDDRIGCEEKECLNPQDHEKIMYTLATKWFDSTIKGIENYIPINNDSDLLENIATIPVTWFATTQGENVTRIPAKDIIATGENTAKLCKRTDPMSPEKPTNACPEPNIGVIHTATLVSHLTDAKVQTQIPNPTMLVINILPFGSRADNSAGTPVTIELKLSNGKIWTKELEPTISALKNKQTEKNNGEYFLNTIRIKLPEEVQSERVQEIRIKSNNFPVEVSSIDIVH